MFDLEDRATVKQETPKRRREWRNLYFTNTGRTCLGLVVHSTEPQCVRDSERFFSERAAFYARGGSPDDLCAGGDGLVPFGNLLFAIPMPW